jgi:hypothetical protein
MIANFERLVLVGVLLVATTTFAAADQIDGSWCSPSGSSMTIEGSQIVTPGGQSITGRYNRHHVDYEVPQGETNAGSRVSADQLNDEEIRVIVLGKDPAANQPSEIWTRCQVIS